MIFFIVQSSWCLFFWLRMTFICYANELIFSLQEKWDFCSDCTSIITNLLSAIITYSSITSQFQWNIFTASKCIFLMDDMQSCKTNSGILYLLLLIIYLQRWCVYIEFRIILRCSSVRRAAGSSLMLPQCFTDSPYNLKSFINVYPVLYKANVLKHCRLDAWNQPRQIRACNASPYFNALLIMKNNKQEVKDLLMRWQPADWVHHRVLHKDFSMSLQPPSVWPLAQPLDMAANI